MQLSLSVSATQRTLRLLLLGAIALACADLTDLEVKGRLQPATKAVKARALDTVTGSVGLADPDQVRALLSTTEVPVTAGASTAKGQPVAGRRNPSAPPAPTGPPPRLTGTLAGGGRHLAVLEVGNVTRVLGPGQTVNGYRILEVGAWSARLRDPSGRVQTLTLELAGGPPAAVVPVTRPIKE